jgi:hypothetical protein
MNAQNLRQQIKQELPALVREDEEIRALILALAKERCADRQQTDDRFDILLRELRQDRETQTRKWEEEALRWAENDKKWEENSKRWEESHREQREKWAENNKRWEESHREQREKWEENRVNWEENRKNFDRMHEEIMAIATKHEHNMGAIGARWGIYAEESFRNGLASILEKSFGIEVINVTEYDERGEVFGRPDQIELDVIVKNGILIICEIKSSIDRGGMYLFERKVRFYEKLHGRKCDRMLVISPMIDARAKQVAEKLGIETYTHSMDVRSLSW